MLFALIFTVHCNIHAMEIVHSEKPQPLRKSPTEVFGTNNYPILSPYGEQLWHDLQQTNEYQEYDNATKAYRRNFSMETLSTLSNCKKNLRDTKKCKEWLEALKDIKTYGNS